MTESDQLESSEGEPKNKKARKGHEKVDFIGLMRQKIMEDEKTVKIKMDIPLGEFLDQPSLSFSKRLEAKGSAEVSYNKLDTYEKIAFDEAMSKELSQVWTSKAVRKAQEAELKDLPPERILRMRWLLTWKLMADGTKGAKARLVVLGYQHPELTQLQTSAPTLSRLGRNMLLSAGVNLGLTLEAGDISSAFLQEGSDAVAQENICVRPPIELQELFKDKHGRASVLRVMKAFYGLTEAPRLFWLDVVKKLTSRGWVQLTTDRCVFIKYSEKRLDEKGFPLIIGLIGTHVDDFLIMGRDGDTEYTVERKCPPDVPVGKVAEGPDRVRGRQTDPTCGQGDLHGHGGVHGEVHHRDGRQVSGSEGH